MSKKEELGSRRIKMNSIFFSFFSLSFFFSFFVTEFKMWKSARHTLHQRFVSDWSKLSVDVTANHDKL